MATCCLVWKSGPLHQLSRGPADTAALNVSPYVVGLWEVKGTGKHLRLQETWHGFITVQQNMRS